MRHAVKLLSIALLSAAACALSPPLHAEEKIDLDQAQKLYEALLHSNLKLEDLTPEQLQAVRRLDQLVREGKIKRRTPREKCLDDEFKRLGQKPSDLDLRVIDLKCSQL